MEIRIIITSIGISIMVFYFLRAIMQAIWVWKTNRKKDILLRFQLLKEQEQRYWAIAFPLILIISLIVEILVYTYLHQ